MSSLEHTFQLAPRTSFPPSLFETIRAVLHLLADIDCFFVAYCVKFVDVLPTIVLRGDIA
jgi:hypothetical protein